MTPRIPIVLALFLILGCSTKSPVHGCKTDGQCPVGARCSAGVCTGDTRPTASIAPLGDVEEFALVRIDGSRSTDPENDVQEHRWSIRSVDAPCEAPVVASREPVAQVRFACAGLYEVSLVVADRLGMPSDPARVQVTVRASTADPIVRTGADVALDHRCAGTPLLCRPKGAIELAAAAASGVSVRWSVQPPAERPLDATRRVTFSPSASALSPTVNIETDGTAISGDWIFRAEAVDAYGVVGAAHTRVSINNRSPVFTFTAPGPFDHVFDAQESKFLAEGAVALSVTDPDGDPIGEVSGIWRHQGDGDEGTFDGAFVGTSVTFAVAVPYAAPADALGLRGGADLVRQIELFAVDVNRTVGSAVIPIVIGNRPPVPAGGAVDTSVPHRFDATRSRYVAFVRAGTFVDPDGDPIVDSTGPGLCGTLLARANDVTAECAVPYQGTPAVDQLVGVRTFPVAARDPWDTASIVPVRTVEIRNSPPTLTAGPPSVPAIDLYWKVRLGSCGLEYWVAGAEFDVSADVSDPDGDPLVVNATPTSNGSVSPSAIQLTVPGTIPFHFVQAGLHYCTQQWKPNLFSVVSLSDGTTPISVGVEPTYVVHDP